jgi:hypothetical protein
VQRTDEKWICGEEELELLRQLELFLEKNGGERRD